MPMFVRRWRTWRARRPSRCMTLPSTCTLPLFLSASVRPAMWRSRVDLPEPEAPIRATISPSATDRQTLSSARLLPNVLVRFSMLIMKASLRCKMTGMVDNLRKNASSRFKVAGIVYQHMVGQMRQRSCGRARRSQPPPLLPAALLKPAAQNVAPRGYFHHQQGADATAASGAYPREPLTTATCPCSSRSSTCRCMP